jgi:thymidylate synthase (FAD)
MKIINANHSFIEESSITKKIERIARICYKSEDKIEEGSDVKIINNLVAKKHFAMLEHASLAFHVDAATYNLLHDAVKTIESLIIDAAGKKAERCYLRFTQCMLPINERKGVSRFIISGNMRAWLETLEQLVIMNCVPQVLYDALMEHAELFMKMAALENCYGVAKGYKYKAFKEGFYAVLVDVTKLTDEERMIHEDVSVLFTVDRGVTHEIVRMRDCSFAQESTRYCNYNLGKFGNEITVIEPCFWHGENSAYLYEEWKDQCESAEKSYFRLLDLKAKPQEARDVLPTSVKAEIVVTTNLREWKHILELRACDSTGPAHPQMKEVMIPCLADMQEKYLFAFGDLTAANN